MKDKMTQLLLIVWITLMILLFDGYASFTPDKKTVYKFEYRGLLWVFLYRQIDVHVKWMSFKKEPYTEE